MTIQASANFDLFGVALVPWRKGFALPDRFSAVVDDDELAYKVEMDVAVTREGIPQCTSVCFVQRDGCDPVSPRGLRSARLGLYLDHAAAAVSLHMEEREGSVSYHPRAHGETITEERPVRPRATGRLTDEHLSEVASVYRQALRDAGSGRPRPRQAIKQHFGWGSPATVARWIAEARTRGFLGPTEQRRAGG